jgi:hypothetical protein
MGLRDTCRESILPALPEGQDAQVRESAPQKESHLNYNRLRRSHLAHHMSQRKTHIVSTQKQDARRLGNANATMQ